MNLSNAEDASIDRVHLEVVFFSHFSPFLV